VSGLLDEVEFIVGFRPTRLFPRKIFFCFSRAPECFFAAFFVNTDPFAMDDERWRAEVPNKGQFGFGGLGFREQ